ncbi:MAG: adenylate/guanylate cyclase domain-containing protein [Candidatus Cloacimonadaceae bacterium]|nr:adenylate/guanylate cyclase domain-containing protein [Candidatus Cloacimonadaceae bacterium]
MKQTRFRHRFPRHYKDVWVLILLALVLAGFTHCLFRIPFLRELETKTIDLRFRLSPKPELADTSIVLIAIDQGSLDFGRRVLQQGWPWPRDFYAVVSQYLGQQQAASVMYDILFDEADFERGGFDGDDVFAAALRESGNAVLSMIFTHFPTESDTLILPHAIGSGNAMDGLWQGVQPPVAPLSTSAKALAGINLLSSDDSTIRRAPLYYTYAGNLYPSLAFAAYLTAKKADASTQIKRFKVDSSGQTYLNWYGKGGADGVFKYYPYKTLLESAVASQNGFTPPIPDGWFKGKHLIIGTTATGLMDLKTSPYTWGMPGMETWATQLSNLLNDDFIRFLTPWQSYLIIFMVSFLVLLMVARMNNLLSAAGVLLLIALLLLVAYKLFDANRIAIDISATLSALVVAWLGILTLSYVMEGRHKRELRQIFNRYLHPDLVNRIVENPDLVQMGGEELSVSIMFSDIYNFTGFSENVGPTDLVSYLNEYFRSFTNSILDHNGLLDKYTGDGLMAVFGAPLPRNDHALLACQAALAHREYALTFKDKTDLSPPEHFHLNTRLGINSGVVVSGNIGSERRMEYTSIGDPVNLASRLEGTNKVFHTHIIISQSTFELVKDVMLCRELDTLRVVGKLEPTIIYELIGDKAKVDMSTLSWLDDYHNALELYRKGDFAAAADIFLRLSESPQKDKASHTMMLRCQKLISNPPVDWDGVYVLAEK